jgi:hypothetical protein
MGTPTIGASFEPSCLAIVLYRAERFAQAVDFYEENPVGSFRGLAFAMGFNLVLALMGIGGWEIWRMLM